MRQAKSYSIVDHKLLHSGFFARLSHLSLALYLFLCVVGDRNGRSFYSDRSICEILRILCDDIAKTRSELTHAGLINYRAPYWWVMSLSHPARNSPIARPVYSRKSNEPTPIRGIVPEGLKTLLQSLSGGGL